MSIFAELSRSLPRLPKDPGSLLSEALARLARVGRSAAGAALAAANAASRSVHVGVQAAAATLEETADALAGTVPGAGLARSLAAQVGGEAARAEAEAESLAARGLALSSGEAGAVPAAPSRGGVKQAAAAAPWSELAADTVVGPLARYAELAIHLGVEAASAAAEVPRGRAADGGGANGERRDSLVTVAAEGGAATLSDTAAAVEIAARLGFGDSRALRRAIERGLQEMRLLEGADELAELLPVPWVTGAVRERARVVVEHAPHRFVDALGNGSGPRLTDLFGAALADADHLVVFVVTYPQVLTLRSTNAGRHLASGAMGLGELAAYLRGRRLHAPRRR